MLNNVCNDNLLATFQWCFLLPDITTQGIEIVSQNYPNEYPNNLDASLVLNLASDQMVKLSIIDFRIQNDALNNFSLQSDSSYCRYVKNEFISNLCITVEYN